MGKRVNGIYRTTVGDFIASIKGDYAKIQALEAALEYLPGHVVEKLQSRLAILTMTHRRGFRLSRGLCEQYEVVFLAEDIFPRDVHKHSKEDFRYFIFIVMHEISHAFREHRCLYFDGISKEEHEKEEDEASDDAIKWFNLAIKEKKLENKEEMNPTEIAKFELNSETPDTVYPPPRSCLSGCSIACCGIAMTSEVKSDGSTLQS